MFSSWYTEDPTEPFIDICRLKRVNHFEIQKIVNGIHPLTNRLLRWGPLDIACTWRHSVHVKSVVEELVMMGAHLDSIRLSGLNPLHVLIFRLAFMQDTSTSMELLEWWITRGVHVNKKCILHDRHQLMTVLPLDLLEMTQHKTFQEKRVVLPFHVKPKRQPPLASLDRRYLTLLFLCHGARYERRNPYIDFWMTFHVSKLKDCSPKEVSLWLHYMSSRLSLPLNISEYDRNQRIGFMLKYAQTICPDDIVTICRQLQVPIHHSIFCSLEFQDIQQYQLERLVCYHHHQKSFYFTKSILHVLYSSGVFPWTHETIPEATRRQWFRHENPLFLSESNTIEDNLKSLPLLFLPSEDSRCDDIMSLILECFQRIHPYGTSFKLESMNENHVIGLCKTLLSNPYHLRLFHQVKHRSDFFMTCLYYVMSDETKIDTLYFGIDEYFQKNSREDFF